MNTNPIKKLVKILAVFAVIFIIIFVALSFWTTGCKVPLQKDSVAFGETEWVFNIKKGTTSECEYNSVSQSYIYTYYNEIVSSYQAKAEYWFVKSDIIPFWGRLYRVEYFIEDQNDDVFNEIVEAINDDYNSKKGFYIDYVSDSCVNLGFNEGATGISATANYSEDGIYVCIEYTF